jgi:hypothetical protein
MVLASGATPAIARGYGRTTGLDVSEASSTATWGLAQLVIRGVVSDVAPIDDGVVVTYVEPSARRVAIIDAAAQVRSDAAVDAQVVAVGLCATAKTHAFIEERGLVDDHGRVLIARPPLLSIPDPSMLPIVDVCPTPRERVLLVKEGLAIVTLDDAGTPREETVLPLVHRARAFAGTSHRSLRGDRPYRTALSVYAPWIFAVDVDADKDLDLVLVHEDRAVIFRRHSDGVVRGPGVERDLGELIGAPSGSDLRAAPIAGGVVVTASTGALPEHSIVATIKGSPERPLATVKRRDVLDGLVIHVSSTETSTTLARIETSLVSLSGVVLTGRVPVELRRDGRTMLTVPLVADVRAGRVDGALPIVDVDLDDDGFVDLVSLGEPGQATWWRGGVDGWTSQSAPLPIPKLDRAVGAPRIQRVILVGRHGPRGTSIGLLGVDRAGRASQRRR